MLLPRLKDDAFRPLLAVATVCALGTLAEHVSLLEPLRIFSARAPAGKDSEQTLTPVSPEAEAALVGETPLAQTKDHPELATPTELTAKSPPTSAKEAENGDDLPSVNAERPPVSIVDPTQSLAPFYESLMRSAGREASAITRILYHGDSLVASDYVTGSLRRHLQQQFGDAGHGFVLMANAWPSYFHNDIQRSATRGFNVSRVVGPYTSDGYYGLGGVSFKAPANVRAEFATVDKGDFGRKVSRFELHYLAKPDGGLVKISIDGVLHKELSTAAPSITSAIEVVTVPDGPHHFEVLTVKGDSRMFGVVLERDTPGVVLDAIGIQGARIRFLDKQDDAHWAEQLRARKPNLIAYHFGANESGDGFAYSMEEYHATMKAVLLQAKAAVPNAGCLILAAMDRARKIDSGMITVPVIPLIVEEQRKTALEVGCAFWNTFEAMGGHGSMARWVRRGLGQADLTHPSGVGANLLGTWIYRALMEGYESHRAKR